MKSDAMVLILKPSAAKQGKRRYRTGFFRLSLSFFSKLNICAKDLVRLVSNIEILIYNNRH